MVTLAVTGAGGNLGRLVSQRLRARAPKGTGVIGCTRDPRRLDSTLFDDVRRADFSDGDGLARAFAGVDRLLLVSIEGDDDMRTRAHAQAAAAARLAGVQRIVYTSFFDVDPASPSIVARVHRDSEAAIRATGCECVFLRNGPYAENMALRVATAARAGGAFHWPGADARLPYIGREDLADAAVAALLTEKAGQPAWRLSGAELLGFDDLCKLVGAAIGTPVRYVPTRDEEYRDELAAHGLSSELQSRRLAYVQAMRMGFMTALTDDFERLVGCPPRRLQDLLPGMDLSPGQDKH